MLRFLWGVPRGQQRTNLTMLRFQRTASFFMSANDVLLIKPWTEPQQKKCFDIGSHVKHTDNHVCWHSVQLLPQEPGTVTATKSLSARSLSLSLMSHDLRCLELGWEASGRLQGRFGITTYAVVSAIELLPITREIVHTAECSHASEKGP